MSVVRVVLVVVVVDGSRAGSICGGGVFGGGV
jgi:hypothetical protein